MTINNIQWIYDLVYPHKTLYRNLAEAADNAYDNYNPADLRKGIDTRDDFQAVFTAGEAYVAWFSNNLLGQASPTAGDSFENPFAFSYTDADKRSLLQALGCRATRDDMCHAYSMKKKFRTAGVAYTLFGLALCDSGVRDELGGGFQPFEWHSDGTLKIYDRYNFTDLKDFGGVAGHGIFKTALTRIFGVQGGTLVGALNYTGITDSVLAIFNVAHKTPDYASNPYFFWRKDGTSFTVTSVTRVSRTVTVTTASPHGMTNTDGGGIGMRDGGTSTTGSTFYIEEESGGDRRPNGVDITVIDANTFMYYDPWDRPDTTSDGTGITAVQKNRFGKSKMMYSIDTLTPQDLIDYNPELLFDAVSRGLVDASVIPGILDVGLAQPNPTIAGIGGMTPQAPVKATINPTVFSNVFDYPLYPQPYNSWSQGTTNETYHLGPYASIPKLIIKNTEGTLGGSCFDSKEWMGEKPEIIKPLYGRLAILPSGAHAGDVAFFIQPWYDFDDTPYNTNDGTASGVPFQSKAAWWKSAVKSSIVVRFGHLTNRPRVYAEVAYSASEFGDISYYPGPDLGSQSDGLVELADVVTATAALSGIVF